MGIFDSLKEKYEISKEKLNTKYDSVKREETEKLEKIIEKSNAWTKKAIVNAKKSFESGSENAKEIAKKEVKEINERFNYYGKIKKHHNEFLQSYSFFTRFFMLGSGNAWLFFFSGGLRKIRNPILFTIIGGSILIPEIINSSSIR